MIREAQKKRENVDLRNEDMTVQHMADVLKMSRTRGHRADLPLPVLRINGNLRLSRTDIEDGWINLPTRGATEIKSASAMRQASAGQSRPSTARPNESHH